MLVPAVVGSVKSIAYLLDGTPMFFMSDSVDFIRTALTGQVEPGKSFVYGFVLRFLALWCHSLTPLILFQVLASAVSVLVLVYLLVRYLRVGPWLALAMGVCCAMEPLQLLYERYVMTETLALTVLSCYLLVLFAYIEGQCLVWLVVAQLVGSVLVSFRLSFLPLVQCLALLVPVLAAWAGLARRVQSGEGRRRWLAGVLLLFVHLAVSVGSFSLAQHEFKRLTAHVAGTPPQYSTVSGFIVLAFWAPLVRVEDFPQPDLGGTILAKTVYPLDNRHDRAAHWAREGGLLSSLRRHFADQGEAERFARQTALNILKRSPWDVAMLYAKTYTDYWHPEYLKRLLPLDRGEDALPADFLAVLAQQFNLQADHLPQKRTLTNVYFYRAWPWYLVLLCAAFVSLLVCCLPGRRQTLGYRQVLAVATVLMTIGACHLAVVRYLHPLGWIVFLLAGCFLDFWVGKGWQGRDLLASEA